MFRRFLPWLAALVAIPGIARGADYTLITILHTNDLHGNVLPDDITAAASSDVPVDTLKSMEPGGLARIASMVKQIRSDMPNVLLVDTGDIIHGGYEDYLSGGMATITAMNAAGYNAGAMGNHEFDFGLPETESVVRTAAHPMLAANIKEKATGAVWNGLRPYVVLNVGDVRVGFIGLATLETLSLQWPPAVASITVEDPVATARALVPEVRKQCDVLVVLSHLGYKPDLDLAKAVPGIDFVIGGHTHTTVDKWQWVGDTLVSQAGAYGRYLGRIDLIVGADGEGRKILSVNGKGGRLWNDMRRKPLGRTYPASPLLPVPSETKPDPDVEAAYAPFRDKANTALGEIIGEAQAAVTTMALPSGETPAGDFVADAVRWFAKSDTAVIDTGSVASGLAPGQIMVKNAFDLIGGFTRQQVVILRLKGSNLVQALTAQIARGSNLKLQVSGLSLSYKTKLVGNATVADVRVGGAPVDPARDYTLAGQAYVIQRFMASAPAAVVLPAPGGTTREALVGYIRSLGKVEPPATGRLTKQ